MSAVVLIPNSDNRVIFKGTDGCLVFKDKKPLQILDRGVNGAVSSINGLTGHVVLPTGDIDVTYITAQAVSALRVVYTDNAGNVSHADSSDTGQLARVAGVSISAASAGAPVKVKGLGVLEDVSFSFTPGNLLYFDGVGQLTETAPPAGFFQVVGRVETPTRIYVSIEEPLIL